MKQESIYSKIIFYLLLLITVLTPLFFLPFPSITVSAAKIVFFYIVSIIILVLYILNIADSKRFTLIKSPLLSLLGLIVIATLAISLWNGSWMYRIFGSGFQSTTFIFLLISSLIVYVVSTQLDSFNKIVRFISVLFIPLVIITLFHFLRFVFGSDFLSFSFFINNSDSFVGSPSDLSIFYGFYSILCISLIEKFRLGEKGDSLVLLSLVFSLIGLYIFHSLIIWVLVLIVSIIWFVIGLTYGRSIILIDPFRGKESKQNIEVKTDISPIAILMVIISLAAILFGTQIANGISKRLDVSFFEARPSIITTATIAKQAYNDNIIGSGANSFEEIWNRYKPAGLNQTDYYNLEFEYGFSWLITWMIIGGVVVLALWILFFIYLGIDAYTLTKYKGFLSPGGTVSLLLFLLSGFLWITTLTFTPGASMLFLTFIILGLFISSLVNLEIIDSTTISLSKLPKKIQGAIYGGLMLAVLVFLYIGYLLGVNATALAYFDKGYIELDQSNEDQALLQFEKAANLNPTDSYYRAIIEISLRKIDKLYQIENPSDEEKKEFSRLINNSIFAADKAIAYNKNNYKNWIAEARVYSRITFIEGAPKKIESSYLRARTLYPHSPLILSEMAQYYYVIGNTEKSKLYIRLALKERPGDIQNILLLAEVEGKNNPEGIKELLKGIADKSRNSNELVQIGTLTYNRGDYITAATVFRKAVTLNPQDVNARYLLAISEAKNGNASSSLEILTELKNQNITIPNIDTIIGNIQNNNDPFFEESEE